MADSTHRIRCKVCFQGFRSPASLKRHVDEAHGQAMCKSCRKEPAGRSGFCYWCAERRGLN